jgi:hypothetical protein
LAKIEYFVSLHKALNVLSLVVEFEVDGNILSGAGCEGLAGFDVMDGSGGIVWTRLEDGMYKGRVTMKYSPPLGSDGFTSAGQTDILKLMFDAKAFGDATLKITDFKVTGLDPNTGKVTYYKVIVGPESSTTNIYRPFDLNRDTIVDLLDLGIIQLYFGAASGMPSWDVVRTSDIFDNPILASYCDFNEDDVVDIVDIMLLYANFSR